MSAPSANGLDVLITVAVLIVLLAGSLLAAWRRDDRERRIERLEHRLGTRREW